MRILIISDLHYEHKIVKGINESMAWYWLISIVEHHKPDLLLSCGDWGSAITAEGFYELLRKYVVLTIYGNHENMSVLNSLYNIKTNEYLPVLMEDGRVYEFEGLRIAGINGIMSEKKRERRGVPRRSPEEFLETASNLAGRGIDILLIHEVPYLPSIFNSVKDSISSRIALRVIKLIKPKVVVNGHMHAGFKYYEFDFSTKYYEY